MVGVFLANHILDGLGIYVIATSVWKMARKYPVRRWFF